MIAKRHDKHLGWLALFVSTGTLICCALPIALMTLGFRATIAAMTSNLPHLVTLSIQKAWVFATSAVLLGVAGWLTWRRGTACSADVETGESCSRARLWNRRVFWMAPAIWGVGSILVSETADNPAIFINSGRTPFALDRAPSISN